MFPIFDFSGMRLCVLRFTKKYLNSLVCENTYLDKYIIKKEGWKLLKTKADFLVEYLETKREASVDELAKLLEVSKDVVHAYTNYLEDAGLVQFRLSPLPKIAFIKYPEEEFEFRNEHELINQIKIYLEANNLRAINKILLRLYTILKKSMDDRLAKMYRNAYDFFYDYLKKMDIVEMPSDKQQDKMKNLIKEVDSYKIDVEKFIMNVKIVQQEFEPVPYYILSILEYGKITQILLDKVKEEVVNTISTESILGSESEQEKIEKEFSRKLLDKLHFLFPDMPETKVVALTEYIKITTLGLGEIEVLLRDSNIEEIVVNNADEPVWLYHRNHSWLKTNIIIDTEETIKHYATIAGRTVNKDITLLHPLLDAHLKTGDRINATLNPITSKGNSITIRKFASKPWTITNLVDNKTLDVNTAALIWTALQHELSILIVGGTGSGKTSTLNVISNFFPPNQRIISIEDTRELVLPDSLHWVPMETRVANPEGEGEVSMLDLVVNSLRMRPDRILVGEIRRKKEAEVLFEAMHTGHSVYSTLHANSVSEAFMRLTNPPIDLPKNVLNSLSLMIVQNRNRRTGKRRTFQVAEVLESGETNLLYELDVSKDKMKEVNKPKRLYETLKLFSGYDESQIKKDIDEKIKILQHLVKEGIDDVHEVGNIVSDYYSNKDFVFKKLNIK